MWSGRPWGVLKTRSRLLRRRRLAAAQVLEDICPCTCVAATEAVTVDDDTVPTEGDLYGLLPYVQTGKHATSGLCSREHPASIFAKLHNIFDGISAVLVYHVEVYLADELGVDVFQALQLRATDRSKSCEEE